MNPGRSAAAKAPVTILGQTVPAPTWRHCYSFDFSTCWYNFARINSSVRMSPAMAAHLTERLWDIGDIVKLIEE